MLIDAPRVRREHVEHFLADLAQRRSPATTNKRYMALRGFFAWCVDEDEITESPMGKMKPPPIPEMPVPIVDDEALKKLVKACSGSDFVDRRDMAIIRLLVDSGLRRAEAAGLTLDDP